ncbi:MAG: hypothetical protein AAFV72_00330 [Cyanobacteria bacterium J06635_1]
MALVDIPPLTQTYGWRGLRYLAGCTSVPEDLAIALGNDPSGSFGGGEGSGKSVDPGIQNEPNPPALILINEAAEANDLTPLPGVGPAAAGHIFDARPDGGYESLEQLPTLVPQVFEPPFSVSVEVLVAWEGS